VQSRLLIVETVRQNSVPLIKYDWDEDQVSFILITEAGDSNSYKEAIKVDDNDKWDIAMEQEMETL